MNGLLKAIVRLRRKLPCRSCEIVGHFIAFVTALFVAWHKNEPCYLAFALSYLLLSLPPLLRR
jgi:hypothetical protein